MNKERGEKAMPKFETLSRLGNKRIFQQKCFDEVIALDVFRVHELRFYQ